MSMAEGLLIRLLAFLAIPLIVFFSIRLGTWAFLATRKSFEESNGENRTYKGDENDGDQA